MKILGISAYYHDSAAALIEDGEIVAAAQEERFSRKKHDASFPKKAIDYCLREADSELSELEHVVFYEKPFLKFERLLETYVSFAPQGFKSFRKATPIWLREKLFQKSLLSDELSALSSDGNFDESRLLFAKHHQSHAASAFFPSPFEEAAILTLDGVGEWATTTAGTGFGHRIELTREIRFPHSLGLLYAAFTYYTGFRVNSGEYKMMGLAPYGEPRFTDLILDHLVDVKPDGSFRLDQRYFEYCTGLRMTSDRFHELFGAPPRDPQEDLTQRDMDIAASIQAVTEEIILRLTRSLAAETGKANLCLAGGVALNCVANGKVLRDGAFENIWIHPAAGDAGGALGSALAAYHMYEDRTRDPDPTDAMQGAYLGPSFSQQEIEAQLENLGANFDVIEDESLLVERTVDMIEAGEVVAWFQGRMEFGPRALGGRSILGDPRSSSMQHTLNMKIKFRESFRPFAPSVLREDVSDWFELDTDSPYMLLVADVAEDKRRAVEDEDKFGIEKLKQARSDIPAVTHVDYSSRVQTVHADRSPLYHALLSEFRDRTGCPVLVNTSFNVSGEPIVCTPEDAFNCFMGSGLDALVAGNCVLRKSDQDPSLRREDYRDRFPPD